MKLKLFVQLLRGIINRHGLKVNGRPVKDPQIVRGVLRVYDSETCAEIQICSSIFHAPVTITDFAGNNVRLY